MAFITKCDFHKNNKLYTTLDASEILSHYWHLCDDKKPRALVIRFIEAEDGMLGNHSYLIQI